MFSKLIYTELFEFYAQLPTHADKTSVSNIKQCFAVGIIFRVKPLFLSVLQRESAIFRCEQ